MRRAGLLAHTGLILSLSLAAFMMIALIASAALIMVPMAKRAADDLAALMVLTAQTWTELPENARPLFVDELAQRHGLQLQPQRELRREHATLSLYVRFLHDAVSRRAGACLAQDIDPHTGECVYIGTLPEGAGYWLQLRMDGQVLEFRFSSARIGTRLPFALALILLGGALVVLPSALWLTRRLTRPLAALAEAAREVGQGREPPQLPEKGPEEIRLLAIAFNRMAAEVRELLANRTTLLAGISHDLRTPLTRLALAVELLPGSVDERLREGWRSDIAQMDRLIGETLLIARGVQDGALECVDIAKLVDEAAFDARRGGLALERTGAKRCLALVQTQALRRILVNLLENVARHAGGRGEIQLDCRPDSVVIRVLDRGPGIPEEALNRVFQPFYRLDNARSPTTGGSGLGLALARLLAEAQGGSLSLEKREGGGVVAVLACTRAGQNINPACAGHPDDAGSCASPCVDRPAG
ncbi:MAG: ATP-binding protein [Halothiobacillaceae bacterium]|jgi:two-component system osmolarity sensor histidine kinase EnvZ|nr:ATP-binding protein [Halothiobacillaceae bacterium]MDY0049175.1 ATP-binding protein [Halothiobacillaceae bacterium]